MLGILDSGVGGLSVYNEIKKLCPNSSILYFADNANIPYGELSKDKIFIFAKEAIDHMQDLGATSIAICCHTIGASVAHLLRNSIKIPLFDISSHSIVKLAQFSNVAIIGTNATVTSNFFQTKLNENLKGVFACPLLIPMIESGKIDIDTIEASLKAIPKEIQNLFLGCTHFPLIKSEIQNALPAISMIDPSNSFALSLIKNLTEGETQFYVTANQNQFYQIAKQFCKNENLPFPILVKSLYSPLLS